MLNDTFSGLLWKTNDKPLLGYDVGCLVCHTYESGGGFAGAPQVFYMAPVEGIAPGQPKPEPASFPHPCTGVEYHIGGRRWNGYHYAPRDKHDRSSG